MNPLLPLQGNAEKSFQCIYTKKRLLKQYHKTGEFSSSLNAKKIEM